MINVTQSKHAIRFRGRSFLALVLAPEAPVAGWLNDLDAWVARSPGFFAGRPVLLDVGALTIDRPALAELIEALRGRDIRIMGIEGARADLLDPSMPPLVSGGRAAGPLEVVDATAPARTAGAKGAEPAPPAATAASTVVIDTNVRSGQCIFNPKGDVVVLGSVGSGAEVIAGGSIHIYGTLRGRAIAGAAGNPQARVFCRRLEAELLSIDGLYKTADEMDQTFRGKAVQAWLDEDTIRLNPLD